MSNITRYRGDTAPDLFSLPIDITNYTFRMTVDTLQNPPDDTTALFEVVGTITDAAAGEFEFEPTAMQTDLPIGTYYYDVEYTDAAGRIKTVAKGKYKIIQDISK